MKKGQTTGRELFQNRLVDMIAKEVRRRKVFKFYVLRDVVCIVNESMTGYKFDLVDTELDA